MTKPKLRKPPKTQEERDKIENEFINQADTITPKTENNKIKTMLLRLPEPLWKDLKKLAFMEESTMTSICIEAIRKKVTKELTKQDT